MTDGYNQNHNIGDADAQPSPSVGAPHTDYDDIYAEFDAVEAQEDDFVVGRSRSAKGESNTVYFYKADRFTRFLIHIVGVIVGLTLVFASGVFWIWGLRYLDVLPDPNEKAPSQSSAQYDYDEFFDRFDKFLDDYAGDGTPNGSEPDSSEQDGDSDGAEQEQSSGTAGMGVTVVELELQFELEGDYTGGLVIVSIDPVSSFSGTDVQENDMIIEANGVRTPNFDALRSVLASKKVGDTLNLRMARYTNGVASTFDIVITLVDVG